MLLSGLTYVFLAVAPGPRLAVMQLNGGGLAGGQLEFLTEHLADRLADLGYEVSSPRAISAVLGLERQRTLMGCSESSCVAEIAAALGVDAILVGDLARLGTAYSVNLKLIAPGSSKRLGTVAATVPREDDLLDALTEGAISLSRQLAEAMGQPAPVPRTTLTVRKKGAEVPGPRRFWWAPMAVSVAGAATGAIGLVLAENARVQLATNSFLEPGAASDLLRGGQTARAVGWAGIGLATAALLTAVGLLVFAPENVQLAPAVSVNGSSASFILAGRF